MFAAARAIESRHALPSLLVLACLLFGVWLRAQGRGMHPTGDESKLVLQALFLAQSDTALPPDPTWPPLTAGLVRLHLHLLVVLGCYPDLASLNQEFVARFALGEGALLAQLRWLPILCGAVTILLTAWLGRLLAGPWAGVLAALLAAVAPLQVLYDRRILTDAPHTTLTTAALWCALATVASGRRPAWPLWLGWLSTGLAFAAKFLGALSALPLVVAAWLRGPRQPHVLVARVGLGFLLSALAAFGACPSLWSHASEYWNVLRQQAGGYQAEWMCFAADLPGPWFHLVWTLPWALGNTGLCLLALTGIVLGMRRARHATVTALVLLVAWYAVVAPNQIRFARYLLPMIPPLCAFAAAAACWLLHWPLRWPWRVVPLTAALAALVAVIPVVAAALDRAHASRQPDTRTLAARWLREHFPRGAYVLALHGTHSPGFEWLPFCSYPALDYTAFGGDFLLDLHSPELHVTREQARARGGIYLWSSFADGPLAAHPERFGAYTAFQRDLGAPLVEFDPGGAPDGLHPAEAVNLGLDGAHCVLAGPRLRILPLR